jgi:hypothetical protein
MPVVHSNVYCLSNIIAVQCRVMARIQMTVPGFRCERCGHTWVARGPRVENRTTTRGKQPPPKLCPGCKSPHWQTPKRPKK